MPPDETSSFSDATAVTSPDAPSEPPPAAPAAPPPPPPPPPPAHLTPLPKTVVLVGLMGAGKSAVGKRLAARLGVPFRDADTEIEQAAGMTVEEIFRTRGEPEFRSGERRVIARLLAEQPPHILATGGGAWMDAGTRDETAAHGVSLWLQADLDELVRRTSRKGGARPLLKQGDPREILARLMAQRDPFYALADVVVQSGPGSADETTERALAALAAYLETEA